MGIFDIFRGKDVNAAENGEEVQIRNVKIFNLAENVPSNDVLNALMNGHIALIKIVKTVEREEQVVELLNKVKAVCGEIDGDVGRFSESWYIATPTNIKIHRRL